jgi:hypothetical protein
MTTTPNNDVAEVDQPSFLQSMVDGGTDPDVAAELERRIHIVEGEEADDNSRRPLSVSEIGVFVAVTVLTVAIGLVVVIL